MANGKKTRTYLDDVPEGVKEQFSKAWGDRKKETFGAAAEHGIKIEQGDSFNKVVVFELPDGDYHFISDIVSTDDISPDHSDVGALCAGLIDEMAATERENACTPIFASNVCDWDSAYAKEVEANTYLRNSIIDACIRNRIVLTGGETANLGDQVRKTGMSWMFTLLSRYDGSSIGSFDDTHTGFGLHNTFNCLPDNKNYEIVCKNGMPLLHVKKVARFLMTADGTGSKSIVCNKIGRDGTDIKDTLAMTCDDATRDGAFPLIASIGVHGESPKKRGQIISHMVNAGKEYRIPLVGCALHESSDVSTYTMNGVVLSEVKDTAAHIVKRNSCNRIYPLF